MSKDCGHHGYKRRELFRRIFYGILIFTLIILFIIFLIWAILRPTKPKFILQDATIYTFNASAPNFITSVIQVTLSARNPNSRIGVYYDRLDVYATYRNQQITLPTYIPPTYQGHKDVDIWSPYVCGTAVPVAPYNAAALCQDSANGNVMLMIKIDGRVRFKVGTFISGSYHLYVRCQAFIPLGSGSSGVVVGDNAIKCQLLTSCSVSV